MHPDRIPQIGALNSKPDNGNNYNIEESSQATSEYSSTSEDQLQDRVLQNCEEFLNQSERDQSIIVRQSLKTS
jgi:hypothetical protein